MRKLDSIFKRFYSKKSEGYGFPKFARSNDSKQSFVIRNQYTKWSDSHLKIFKEEIKCEFHREIPNDDQTEMGINLNFKSIDINIITKSISLPNFSKSKYSKRYIKIQQQLSHRRLKKNYSKNTKKLQKKLNIINKKIKNQKEDYFHKISKNLVNYDCGRITIEDLKIKKMKESDSKHLNKLISDVSQRCYQCGYTEKLNQISQSEFHCKVCSHSNNADRNASLNILNYDLWSLKQKTLVSLWKSKSLSVSCEEQEH